MKILCIGDSLGRPRWFPEYVGYDKTWPSILEKKCGHKIIRNFVPSRQSKDILENINNDIFSYNPNLVILQVGVVELYPRALTRIEKEIVKKIPIFSDQIHKFIKKNRKKIVKSRRISYGSIENYLKNIEEIKLKIKTPIIFLPPLYHPAEFEINQSPGYNSKIEIILKNKNFNWFKKYSDYWKINASELLASDGHHLSSEGHKKISEILLKKIL